MISGKRAFIWSGLTAAEEAGGTGARCGMSAPLGGMAGAARGGTFVGTLRGDENHSPDRRVRVGEPADVVLALSTGRCQAKTEACGEEGCGGKRR